MIGATRRLAARAAIGAALLAPLPSTAAPDVCTWGGTALQPTAEFTANPGLSNVRPASDYVEGHVTGVLAGAGARCTGTMVWDGVIHPGATCTSFFLSGTVSGVPGVKWMIEASTAYGRALLFDEAGERVGTWGSNVLSLDTPAAVAACNTPEGLTVGRLHATMELFR